MASALRLIAKRLQVHTQRVSKECQLAIELAKRSLRDVGCDLEEGLLQSPGHTRETCGTYHRRAAFQRVQGRRARRARLATGLFQAPRSVPQEPRIDARDDIQLVTEAFPQFLKQPDIEHG